MRVFAYFILSLLLAGCNNNPQLVDSEDVNNVKFIEFQLVNTLPHDTTSFTEGLFFHDNKLFESSGAPAELPQTRSIFGIVNQETGEIDVKGELDKRAYFGEGITLIKGKIFQLTYKNQVCFVYDAKTYKKIGQYSYSNAEGWGLTSNGTDIIMSDGSDKLTFKNPDNFKTIRVIPISENGYVVSNLNELEFIKGYIYANIWLTNTIVKIDPLNGNVVGKMDLTSIFQKELTFKPNAGEMNGIAYNPSNNKIYVTGKLWSTIYQLNFTH